MLCILLQFSPLSTTSCANFRSFFCSYNYMSSSFLTPLPATHSERHLSLGGQSVLFDSEVHLEVVAGQRPPTSEYPVIENYYCQSRAGELVKVTIVRIGSEVLRLTDRILLRRQDTKEDDDRTKCSSNNSQQEGSSQRDPKPCRTYFSKSSKALLSALQEWVKKNDPESLRPIIALRQEYGSEHEVADFLACNSMVRDAFLHFCDWFFAEGPQVRVAKLATRWMKRCLTVREDERMKEDYIEEILQKM